MDDAKKVPVIVTEREARVIDVLETLAIVSKARAEDDARR